VPPRGTLPSPFVPDAPSIKRTPRTWVVYGGPDTLPGSLDEIGRSGGGPVRWFVTDPTHADEAAAEQHGLKPERDVLQLRRPLPVDEPAPAIPVRAFVPGEDEVEWIEVNNHAFATHPEQGAWTLADIAVRESEPWFDPSGFLLHHDVDTGALAGFVWTKVHDHVSPALGEIYVIGVDPRFQGRGLGRTLTLVGLDWLHRVRGIDHGMLYVDATNAPAIAMYTRLGFAVHHTDRAFVGEA
jgi:mycothiol synthase